MSNENRIIVPVGKREVVASVSRQIAITEKLLSNATNKECQETLNDILLEMEDCQRCPLCSGRKSLVFGAGNPHAKLVIIGEAPGRDEDLQGEPFVGNAGQLLTKIIKAMGFERNEVYLCNVLKCRPPDNRNPNRHEISTCSQFLFRQIRAISPQAIITLGTSASQTLLNSQDPISWLRGYFNDYCGIPVMSTLHPAFLLRTPERKEDVWEDVKQVVYLLNGTNPDTLEELTYTNKQTGLMWARNGNIAEGKLDWYNAMDWVDSLKYAGYTDWRLPSIEEFEAFGKSRGYRLANWIKTTRFNNAYDIYWTSSASTLNNNVAWTIHTGNDLVCSYYKNYNHYVWPVRSIQVH